MHENYRERAENNKKVNLKRGNRERKNFYQQVSECPYAPLSLAFNPGEGIDVCKCIVPLGNGGALNTSSLVRLVEEGERWEGAFDHLQGVLLQNWGGTDLNRTVTCGVIKANANNRRTFSPLPR
ncbi:hypothetical protein TNCV_2282311 [Trichonephila clavipes]|nr:hypothetical protein TNCV_2282311 [Trichonephila clavipes]